MSAPKQLPAREVAWEGAVPDHEWEIYKSAIRELRARKVPFALGGAFALATYTGYLRNTKDIDLYVVEAHRDRAVDALGAAGLGDLHATLPYDRGWIYRSHAGEVIVDVIWSTANYVHKVEPRWVDGGPQIRLRGEVLRVLAPEVMAFCKLFIVQRTRCDWPDVINLLYGAGAEMDWPHLLELAGPAMPLLRGVLSAFQWLCPGRAAALPKDLWARVQIPAPETGPDHDPERVRLLDSRPWLAPDLLAGA